LRHAQACVQARIGASVPPALDRRAMPHPTEAALGRHAALTRNGPDGKKAQ
jgi:hypothetical protein